MDGHILAKILYRITAKLQLFTMVDGKISKSMKLIKDVHCGQTYMIVAILLYFDYQHFALSLKYNPLVPCRQKEAVSFSYYSIMIV